MRASVAVGPRTVLSDETPVVRGRCCMPVGCPGCSDSPCLGRHGCLWQSKVLKSARLSNAVAWHAQLCENSLSLPDDQRVNFVRVVCLLAIIIQACTSDELWDWLMTNLRPVDVRKDHPIYLNSAQFGNRFANAIPPPPAKEEKKEKKEKKEPDAFSHEWFAIGSSPSGAGDATTVTAEARAEWESGLTELLLRLQTNLFYLDDTCIGIFPLACQLEHSCRPNATVERLNDSASLVVRSGTGRVIGKGDRVSFCYLVDGADSVGDIADRMPLIERRRRILDEIGFWCRCPACEADEAALSPEQRLEVNRAFADAMPAGT